MEILVDVMHTNDVTFLTSVSKEIHYRTILAVDNLEVETLERGLKNVVRAYSIRDFHVILILVDIQFKVLKDRNKVGMPINTVSKGEHVTKMERFHRVVEERARCYYTMLPFDYLPRIMVIHLMITICFYVNAFVWLKGISQVLPPITIVEGIVLDYNLHFRVIFGEFIQTYEGTKNDMSKRTIDAIALEPASNMQGGI